DVGEMPAQVFAIWPTRVRGIFRLYLIVYHKDIGRTQSQKAAIEIFELAIDLIAGITTAIIGCREVTAYIAIRLVLFSRDDFIFPPVTLATRVLQIAGVLKIPEIIKIERVRGCGVARLVLARAAQNAD